MDLSPGLSYALQSDHHRDGDSDGSLAKRRHLDHQPRGISIRRRHVEIFKTLSFLAVGFDMSLGFKTQVTAAMEKGARYVAQQNHVARTTQSISGELIRRKYVAVITLRIK